MKIPPPKKKRELFGGKLGQVKWLVADQGAAKAASSEALSHRLAFGDLERALELINAESKGCFKRNLQKCTIDPLASGHHTRQSPRVLQFRA